MQMRWGPFIMILFLLISTGYSKGNVVASDNMKVLKRKLKFVPKIITTRVFIVTGIDQMPVGPVVIQTHQLLVKGTVTDQQIVSVPVEIQSRQLIVTGKNNADSREK